MKLSDVIRHAQYLSRKVGFSVLRSEYLAKHREMFVDTSVNVFEGADRESEFVAGLQIIPVESVAAVAREKSGFASIEFVAVNDGVFGTRVGSEDPALRSYVETKNDSATIIYRESDRFCWQRFAIIKELLHLYTLTGADKNPYIKDASQVLDEAISSMCDVPDAEEDLPDETVALAMAVEIMIPWGIRPQLKTLLEKGASYYQIAKAFMMPQEFVRRMFGEWRGSCGASGRTYAEISWAINKYVDGEFTGRF